MTLEHSYSQLESAVCWFLVREENRRTRRKTLEAEKRTNTNSTHLWRRVRESNPGHIGGRRALSPLHHPCFPYATCSNLLLLCNLQQLKYGVMDRNFQCMTYQENGQFFVQSLPKIVQSLNIDLPSTLDMYTTQLHMQEE